jgi:hypothetical protein
MALHGVKSFTKGQGNERETSGETMILDDDLVR